MYSDTNINSRVAVAQARGRLEAAVDAYVWQWLHGKNINRDTHILQTTRYIYSILRSLFLLPVCTAQDTSGVRCAFRVAPSLGQNQPIIFTLNSFLPILKVSYTT